MLPLQRAQAAHASLLLAIRIFATLGIFAFFIGGCFSKSAYAQPAPNARPQGFTLRAGSASVSETPSETDISQTSQSAVVSWQSFDVGSAQTVVTSQPNTSSAILDEIIGPDRSQIAGRVTATGQMYLVNQSGLVFHQGALINAGSGFVASTQPISREMFQSGQRDATGTPPPGTAVSNAGHITVAPGGFVTLVADKVSNSGAIDVTDGVLTAGGTATHPTSFTNTGTISLGTGTLDALGLLNLGGRTSISLAGTATGQYGDVSALSGGTIEGGFDVSLADGFMPVAGDSFDILRGMDVSLAPTSGVDLPSLAPGLAWEQNFLQLGDGTDIYRLDVTGVGSVPLPSTWALMVTGLAGLGFMGYWRRAAPPN